MKHGGLIVCKKTIMNWLIVDDSSAKKIFNNNKDDIQLTNLTAFSIHLVNYLIQNKNKYKL